MTCKTAKQKLRSGRGASIAFALLLFLICSVVGIGVLTAATVSAGRFSVIPEADQRYFAVNSAAGLFADTLDGQVTTFTCTRVTTVTFRKTYTKNGEGEVTDSSSEETGRSEIYSTTAARGRSLLEDAAIDLVFGSGSSADPYSVQKNWDSWKQDAILLTAPTTRELAFSAEMSGDSEEVDLSAISGVTVTEELTPQGNLILTLSGAADASSAYRLRLTFQAEVVSERTSSQSPEKTVKDDTDGTRTVTDESTDVRTTKITWRLVSVQKVSTT